MFLCGGGYGLQEADHQGAGQDHIRKGPDPDLQLHRAAVQEGRALAVPAGNLIHQGF